MQHTGHCIDPLQSERHCGTRMGRTRTVVDAKLLHNSNGGVTLQNWNTRSRTSSAHILIASKSCLCRFSVICFLRLDLCQRLDLYLGSNRNRSQ